MIDGGCRVSHVEMLYSWQSGLNKVSLLSKSYRRKGLTKAFRARKVMAIF